VYIIKIRENGVYYLTKTVKGQPVLSSNRKEAKKIHSPGYAKLYYNLCKKTFSDVTVHTI
jgi:hypothetical protein